MKETNVVKDNLVQSLKEPLEHIFEVNWIKKAED